MAVRIPSAVDVLPGTDREHDNVTVSRCVDDAMRVSWARGALVPQSALEFFSESRLVVESSDEVARFLRERRG